MEKAIAPLVEVQKQPDQDLRQPRPEPGRGLTALQVFALQLTESTQLETVEQMTESGERLAQLQLVVSLPKEAPTDPSENFFAVEIDRPLGGGVRLWSIADKFEVGNGQLRVVLYREALGENEPFPADLSARLRPGDLPTVLRVSFRPTSGGS